MVFSYFIYTIVILTEKSEINYNFMSKLETVWYIFPVGLDTFYFITQHNSISSKWVLEKTFLMVF